MLMKVNKDDINNPDQLKELCIMNKKDLKFDFSNNGCYSNKILWIFKDINIFVDGIGNKSVVINDKFFNYTYLFKCLNNSDKFKNPIIVNNFLKLIIKDY